MSDLILLNADWPAPCIRDPNEPSLTMCGRIIGEGVTISEAQAVIYYHNDRCIQCRPGWHASARSVRRT